MTTRAVSGLLCWIVGWVIGLSECTGQTYHGVPLETRSTGTGTALCGSCTVPRTLSSSVWLGSKDEPGEQIVIRGTVFKSDGTTPDSGVVFFLYQTDAGGYYHRPQEDVFHPRLYGWLMTGSDGQYAIHTIKPAPEVLAASEPSHIHVHIFGNGMPEHFLHEFWFAGDRNISSRQYGRLTARGSYSPILSLTRSPDGTLQGTRNIKVVPTRAWQYEEE